MRKRSSAAVTALVSAARSSRRPVCSRMRITQVQVGARYVVGSHDKLSRPEQHGGDCLFLPAVEAVALEVPPGARNRQVRCRLVSPPSACTTADLGSSHPLTSMLVGEERHLPARRISAPLTAELIRTIDVERRRREHEMIERAARSRICEHARTLLTASNLRESDTHIQGGVGLRLDRSIPVCFSGRASVDTDLVAVADGAVDVVLLLTVSELATLKEALAC